MGNCTSGSHQFIYQDPLERKKCKITPPDCSLLIREQQCLAWIFNNYESIFTTHNHNCIFHQDSGIGILKNQSFVLVGGTDTSGKITTDFIQVSSIDKTIQKLVPLPYPCKLGSLYHFQDFIYYVGGMAVSPENENELIPCPLMRYDLSEHLWTVFASPELEKRGNRYRLDKYLYYGTCFYKESVILVVGGMKIRGRKGKQKMSRDILSLNLYDRKFEFKKENIKSPFNVICPEVVAGRTDIFIGGGKNRDNTPNLKSFFVSITDEIGRATEIPKLPDEVAGNYPGKFFENEVMLYCHPEIYIYVISKFKWYKFYIEEYYIPTDYLRKKKKLKFKRARFILGNGEEYKYGINTEESSDISSTFNDPANGYKLFVAENSIQHFQTERISRFPEKEQNSHFYSSFNSIEPTQPTRFFNKKTRYSSMPVDLREPKKKTGNKDDYLMKKLDNVKKIRIVEIVSKYLKLSEVVSLGLKSEIASAKNIDFFKFKKIIKKRLPRSHKNTTKRVIRMIRHINKVFKFFVMKEDEIRYVLEENGIEHRKSSFRRTSVAFAIGIFIKLNLQQI